MPADTSIVIVSYHTGPALAQCLLAVAALPERPEIIVVDNGNPPETTAALQTIAAAAPNRIRLLTGHGNIGFAKAINLGAKAASGDWLWILNPDAAPARDALTRLLHHAAAVPQPALIGARILNLDGSEQRGGRRDIFTPRYAFTEGLVLYKLLPLRRYNWHQQPRPDRDLLPVPAVTGASMFLPLAAFLALGGLSEAYFLHVEDMDFCLRWRQAGHQAYYANDVELPHVCGSSDVPSLQVERWKVDSFTHYFRTHFEASHPRWVLMLTNLLVGVRYQLLRVRSLFHRQGEPEDTADPFPAAQRDLIVVRLS